MIKNGGQLIARAVITGKARARLRRLQSVSDSPQDYIHTAALPPAFLLPAWSYDTCSREKTSNTARRSSSSFNIQRHASTHAHAELPRNHDVYTPDWLNSDNADPAPTASTSKVVQQEEHIIKDTSQLPDVVEEEQVGIPSAEGASTALPIIDKKGKAVEKVVNTTSPRRTKARRRSHTIPMPVKKDYLAKATEASEQYLERESSSSGATTASIPTSFPSKLDLPLNAISPSIRNLLMTPSHSSKTPATLQYDDKTLQTRLTSRLGHASAILNACLRHFSKFTTPLWTAQIASVRKQLHQLLSLDAETTNILLKSLSSMQDVDPANASRLARIVPDVLVLHVLRQDHLSVTVDKTPHSSAHEEHSNLVSRHLIQISRKIRSLSDSYRRAFLASHLPTFAALVKQLPLSHASTSAVAIQLLDCFQISLNDEERLHSQDPDVIMQALLRMGIVILKHALQPVKVGVTNLPIHADALEESSLRTWSLSILPFLETHYTNQEPSMHVMSALATMQRLACQAGMARLAVQMALDVSLIEATPTSPKYMRPLAEHEWQRIIRLCLHAGRPELAEELLAKITSTTDRSDQHLSKIWHSRLQVALKSTYSDSSAFFDRLDNLLRSIEDAGHKPDPHFLSTFLRYIPSFPTSLDKTCDLFHAAFSLSRKTARGSISGEVQDIEQGVVQTRLAAHHGDIGLFERGIREAVQLPWSPLATSQQADMQDRIAVSNAARPSDFLLSITRKSQDMRLAILQSQLVDAKVSFDDLTSSFCSMLSFSDCLSHNSRNPMFKTARELWVGSFVRLFSEYLRHRDWWAAHNLLAESLDVVGSQYIGSQAVKRLLLAACSPSFHSQDFRSIRRDTDHHRRPPVLEWTKLSAALFTSNKWAEDVIRCRSEGQPSAVDEGLTVRQRFRSVLEQGYSTHTLARAAAIYVVSSTCLRNLDTGRRTIDAENELEAMEAFLVTMNTLQCNIKFDTWWRVVEKEMVKQVEAWEAVLGQPVGHEIPWVEMKRLCLEYEQARVSKRESASDGTADR